MENERKRSERERTKGRYIHKGRKKGKGMKGTDRTVGRGERERKEGENPNTALHFCF
jgi:hypothetical protein